MPSTVYQRVIIHYKEHSRKDLRRIANWINSIYSKDHAEEPPKVEQQEDELTFMVYCYPDEMITIMDQVIDKFFKNKTLTAKRHNDYLNELAKCKETGKPIRQQPKSAPPKGKYNSPNQMKNVSCETKPKHHPVGENRFSQSTLPKKPGFITTDNKVKFAGKEVKSIQSEIKNEIPVATTLRKRKTAQELPNN